MTYFIKKFIEIIASDKIVKGMKKLYPKWEVEDKITSYYLDKIKYCFLILIAGFTIIFLSKYIGNKNDSGIVKELIRNDYGKGDKSIYLDVTTEERQQEKSSNSNNKATKNKATTIYVNIPERRYTQAEISRLYDEFETVFFETVTGENISLDHVTKDLNFARKIEGYPFTISYRTTKPLILSSEGKINEERLSDYLQSTNDNLDNEVIIENKQATKNSKEQDKELGADIEITATASYYDYEEEISFFVSLYEKELSENEKFEKEINEAIDEANNESIYEGTFSLPEFINGKRVSFSSQKDTFSAYLPILIVFCTLIVFFAKDNEIEKEIQNRDKQIQNEYPRLINKFTLFYNAGMPIRRIWGKICADYEIDQKLQNKNYLYEEMIITRNQILDGKNEVDAYEEFANRINIKCISIFISLITQSIIMGRKDLSETLKFQCEDAFIERKNNAKKLFEEAGTKLLIPMFMMLLVVMIIIMFPAFYSFKM